MSMFSFQAWNFSWVAVLFIKSIVVLGMGLFIHKIMKSQRAAFRHSFLTMVLFSLLLLPVFTFIPSSLHLGILYPKPGSSHREVFSLNAVSIKVPPDPLRVAGGKNGSPVPVHGISPNSNNAGKNRFLINSISIIWMMAFLLFIQRISAALFYSRRISIHGKEIKGHLSKRVIMEFARLYSLKRDVRIRENHSIAIPYTWGIRRPVILLPHGSDQWPENQRFSILFHELSHIHRNDFFLNLLSFFVCALFWFNPLAWIVFRRLKEDQEKACDEMVLSSGIKPSSYASYLLDMKKHFGKQRLLQTAVIGLAAERRFPERLKNILHHQNPSKEAKMKHKIMWFAVLFLALFLVGTANPYKANGSLIPALTQQEQEKKKEMDSEKPDHETLIVKKSGKDFIISAPGGMTLEADGKIYSDFLTLNIIEDRDPPQVIIENPDGRKVQITAEKITLIGKSGKGPHILIRKDPDGKLYELKADNMKFSIRGKKEEDWFGTDSANGDKSKWMILKSGDEKSKKGEKKEEILVWTQKESGPKKLALVSEKGNRKGLKEFFVDEQNFELKEEEIKKLLAECRQSLDEIRETELREKITAKLEALEKTLDRNDEKEVHKFFLKEPSEDAEKTIGIFIDSDSDATVLKGGKFLIKKEGDKDVIVTSGKADFIYKNDRDFAVEKGEKIIYLFNKQLDDSQVKKISDLVETVKSKLPKDCRIEIRLNEDNQGRIIFTFTPGSDASSGMGSDAWETIRGLTQPLKEIIGAEKGDLALICVTEKKKE